MLQAAKDLQNRAVTELFKKAHSRKKELTFCAPTGSGKTRMMADFMNRMLEEDKNVVFLVSTLSKAELPKQDYETFKECADSLFFPKLKPYLITTDSNGEGDLFIPLDYNVYVLPHSLYKEKGILKRGIFDNFLKAVTKKDSYFEPGKGKKIYLVRDESHQATNNLDEKKAYFERIFNFSATPKRPYDVEITIEEAKEAKLIKDPKWEEDLSYTLDDALDKLIEIKDDYYRLLGVRPCLIIQISNAKKADYEFSHIIRPALNRHAGLKWMSFVNTYKKDGDEDTKKEKLFDTNDNVKNELPHSEWKKYAKGNHSTIDVIIFKMVITEGWDIPRACMLYQIRDTNSVCLDKQVVGRVCRNPRLADFDKLTPEQQDWAMKGWIWGVKSKNEPKTIPVKLWQIGNVDLRSHLRIGTTKLEPISDRSDFSAEELMSSQHPERKSSIFKLYQKYQQGENELTDKCYEYANGNVQRWWDFMESYDTLKRKYYNYIRNYSESMKVDKVTSLPTASLYAETTNKQDLVEWLWEHCDNDSHRFSFDSEAERDWANILEEHADDFCAIVKTTTNEECHLWGKNFPYHSEVHYEYYSDGIHKSYPDFVMKDRRGRIHIFEVKSLEGDGNAGFDVEEYRIKIDMLKECYCHCSQKLRNHIFYVPVKENSMWTIWRYLNGVEKQYTKKELLNELKTTQEVS